MKSARLPTPPLSDPAARQARAQGLIGGQQVGMTGTFRLAEQEIKNCIKRAKGKVTPANKATVLLVGEAPEKNRKGYEETIRAARERGATIVERDLAETIGATPFIERLVARLKFLQEGKASLFKYWHIGAPATSTAIAEVEARIGMPLDPTLRSFYLQANGATFGYRSFLLPKDAAAASVTRVSGPYDSELFLGPTYGRDLWDGEPGELRAFTTNIPPIEELFAPHRLVTLLPTNAPIKVGRKQCPAGHVRDQLFLFDAHRSYNPTFLFLDRETNTMDVVVGGDYGVSFGDWPTISVDRYFDWLVASSLMSVRFGDHDVDRGYVPN